MGQDETQKFMKQMEAYEKLQKEKKELEEFQEYKKNKAIKAIAPPLPHQRFTQANVAKGKLCNNPNHQEKKVVAVYMMKWLNILKFTSMGSMVGLFLAQIMGTFNQMTGYGVIIIGVAGGAYVLNMAQKEIAYLKTTYGV